MSFTSSAADSSASASALTLSPDPDRGGAARYNPFRSSATSSVGLCDATTSVVTDNDGEIVSATADALWRRLLPTCGMPIAAIADQPAVCFSDYSPSRQVNAADIRFCIAARLLHVACAVLSVLTEVD